MLVTRNTAIGNGNSGILVGMNSTVTHNTSNENGDDGIAVGQKSLVSHNTANDNDGDGIEAVCPSTITNNEASNNGDLDFNFDRRRLLRQVQHSPDNATRSRPRAPRVRRVVAHAITATTSPAAALTPASILLRAPADRRSNTGPGAAPETRPVAPRPTGHLPSRGLDGRVYVSGPVDCGAPPISVAAQLEFASCRPLRIRHAPLSTACESPRCSLERKTYGQASSGVEFTSRQVGVIGEGALLWSVLRWHRRCPVRWDGHLRPFYPAACG